MKTTYSNEWTNDGMTLPMLTFYGTRRSVGDLTFTCACYWNAVGMLRKYIPYRCHANSSSSSSEYHHILLSLATLLITTSVLPHSVYLQYGCPTFEHVPQWKTTDMQCEWYISAWVTWACDSINSKQTLARGVHGVTIMLRSFLSRADIILCDSWSVDS